MWQGGPNNDWTAPWMQGGSHAANAYGEWTFGSNLSKMWSSISGGLQTDGVWDFEKIGKGVAAAGGAALLYKQIRGDLASARAADESQGVRESDARMMALEMQLAELNRRALESESRVNWMPIILGGGAVATLLVVMVMMKGKKS
tara:strand:+ start:140 stop:574 length:435 start_codon:yes stop_codon:yes gene_type:complete